MNALTKNHEDELVQLHEQWELKKRIPSFTWDWIGGLIEAAHDRMQVDKAANHIAFCRYSVMNHEGGIYCTSQELFLTMLPDRPSVQFGQH